MKDQREHVAEDKSAAIAADDPYAQNVAEKSLAMLREAVVQNPGSARAWRRLGSALRRQAQNHEAIVAYSRSITASFSDRTLVEAAKAVASVNWQTVEGAIRDRLADEPDDVVALWLGAEIELRSHRLDAAEKGLRRCLALVPTYAAAHYSLATVFFRQAKFAEALGEVDRVLLANPADRSARTLKAAIAATVGNCEESIALHQGLLVEQANQPAIWTSVGHSLRMVGRIDESISAYRQAIALKPAAAEAYWSLANLKTVSFSAQDTASMQDLLEHRNVCPQDRVFFHFALGKAFEDQRDFDKAFINYQAGNVSRRKVIRYDAQSMDHQFARMASFVTGDNIFDRKAQGEPSSDPIFIVGLPRSGSTLVEQILASHPLIEGTQELPYIEVIIRRLAKRAASRSQSPYPEILNQISPADLHEMGCEYLRRAKLHRKSSKPFFIDKMPNNFLHVGLIKLILPNAKIIDVRRHPLATCVSIYKQLFSGGQEFSYDLGEIAQYYAGYVNFMNRVDSALPTAVHRIHYENLVRDTETEARKLLAYVGLAFDPLCLRFYENDRAVRTPSSEQVRQPIFANGLDHWKAFSPWLAPAELHLGDLPQSYPAAV